MRPCEDTAQPSLGWRVHTHERERERERERASERERERERLEALEGEEASAGVACPTQRLRHTKPVPRCCLAN